MAENIISACDPFSYVDTFMHSIIIMICMNMMLSILLCH